MSAAEKAQDQFYPLKPSGALPDIFPSPFDVVPHALAAQAASALKQQIPELCSAHQFDTVDGGKMFGVLVVQKVTGEIGYLAAYSGMLAGQWLCDGFVPPVFDIKRRSLLLAEGEQQLATLTQTLQAKLEDPEFVAVDKRLSALDTEAKQQLDAAKLANADRKQQRHLKRDQASITPEQLDALANESRNDKFSFKKLKSELIEQSAELRSQWLQMQSEINAIKTQRKKLSHELQIQLFSDYQLRSVGGKTSVITAFFEAGNPPSGAGDCAAIKLTHYANLHNMRPLALAEFWWGAPPLGGLREHGRFYPSCRSRCRVLLPFLLDTLTLSVPLHERVPDLAAEHPHTLYEDDDIVLVDKPAGLLSVPGKVLTDSVETRIKARYPDVAGVMLLHRLDQATSGVMIAAKNPRAYKNLQHQFQDRSIKKKYIAVLEGTLQEDQGEINLPLRIDIYDRPRQMVCAERGKSALTKYAVLSRENNTTRVAFYPHTGRTHQLRVHAAHVEGLHCPILGDELYGTPSNRLHLHAAELTFDHPVTGARITVTSEVSF